MKTISFLIFFTLFVLSSCKKSMDADNSVVNFTLLTTKPWKAVLTDNNTATNPKGGTILYYPYRDCDLDDSGTFFDNGTLTISTGPNRCYTPEPPTINHKYSIDKVNNTITIDNAIYTLAEISETQLKYYAITTTASGTQYVIYINQH